MPRNEDSSAAEFEEYFTARRDTVRRAAYLLCGDWHWADDLTQIAFVRLASGWHRVRDPAALDAYVRTCLMRAYLDETRRVWRRRERSQAELPDWSTADDNAETTTRRVVFAAALRQIAPRQRAVLVCRFYQGLDVAETADALGCSAGTVKSQTAKALTRLRALLDDPLPEAGLHPLIALEGTA
jgi:RNA polymerase sigma-70 factor (sigma-E family)